MGGIKTTKIKLSAEAQKILEESLKASGSGRPKVFNEHMDNIIKEYYPLVKTGQITMLALRDMIRADSMYKNISESPIKLRAKKLGL